MIPYEPRHEKTCLGTDHLIFCGDGVGWVFSSRFSSDKKKKKKTEIFFLTFREPKYFFSAKQKHFFFFSKQHICSKCILLNLYVRVFLNPIYKGLLFICSYIHVSWIFGSECI